ncbi:unnamed protein product [Candidula unifasciata]|uniref:BZIP domain-containing protein n=1 Tax=Candidula unifasciata TaxID=100452 RepID=A0A8S3YNR8_9EUPU|nr:unnamed protein product [Candidula unifasciata]
MTTSVTTHSSSVRGVRGGTLTSLPMSMDSSGMSPNTSTSLPSSPVSVTAMSGLLSSRNLVQDEKLVVATLATLNSGSASSLIKQDLKWIIQSRRKAEGKAELQVEFKKPVKDELTSEEIMKRARRRELNRLAARRSREKGQKRKDLLVEEIRKLQSENSELVNILGDLTEERDNIIFILRQHMKQCSDYKATQSAAIGVSQKVLDLLGFPLLSASEAQVQDVSDLYINTGDSCSSHSQSQSPCVVVKQEKCDFSSCPVSPVMAGVGTQLMIVNDTSMPGGSIIYDESSSSFTSHNIFSPESPPAKYSFPLGNLQFDSPPISCAVPLPPPPPPPRSCAQSLEAASSNVDTSDQQEIIQYKHKLMKYRKHFSQASQSSFAGSRGSRASLERSFSFPCTVRESRSNFSSPAVSESYKLEPYKLEPCKPDVMTLPQDPTANLALASDKTEESVGCPLNLAVRKTPSTPDSDREKMFTVNPMDTWPPAGMRSMPFRNLERRWSVDHSLPEPLNLSSKVRSEVKGHHLTEMTPRNNPGQQRRDSRHSEFSVDTYR